MIKNKTHSKQKKEKIMAEILLIIISILHV